MIKWLSIIIALFLLIPSLPAFSSSEMDQCPTPPSDKPYQNWSCGSWEFKNGVWYRTFNLYVSEYSTIDIGNNKTINGAWTFNGSVPGPTMRMTEGDNVVIYVHNDQKGTNFAHSLHMHSIHRSGFDGAGINQSEHEIPKGVKGQYIFVAQPAGVYPYHCHIEPIDLHIVQGLHGIMIIDPKIPRAPANEIILESSSYNTNWLEEYHKQQDHKAEYFTYNGKINQYINDPIPVKVGELNRIYLSNMIEYRDTVSFHLHGLMFSYYPSGTLNSSMIYTDIVTLSQGDRGIVEFIAPFSCCNGSSENRNTFMFHSHQNDVTAKGLMGFIDVLNQSLNR